MCDRQLHCRLYKRKHNRSVCLIIQQNTSNQQVHHNNYSSIQTYVAIIQQLKPVSSDLHSMRCNYRNVMYCKTNLVRHHCHIVFLNQKCHVDMLWYCHNSKTSKYIQCRETIILYALHKESKMQE